MDNSPVSLTAKQLAPKPAYRHPLPTVSPLLRHWFLRYAEHYVRRNMHGLRVAGEHYANSVAGRPVLVYMNHPGWWDPMIAAVLARRYFSAGSHTLPSKRRLWISTSSSPESVFSVWSLATSHPSENSWRSASRF